MLVEEQRSSWQFICYIFWLSQNSSNYKPPYM